MPPEIEFHDHDKGTGAAEIGIIGGRVPYTGICGVVMLVHCITCGDGVGRCEVYCPQERLFPLFCCLSTLALTLALPLPSLITLASESFIY